ncbi:hypothetical protein, partial [Streptomyces sp. wa1063]|uniref:hypothetical protein n=1 Tax=Streptomyces sp. wa1063 TaxID=1828212 RepID=UPI001C54FD08
MLGARVGGLLRGVVVAEDTPGGRRGGLRQHGRDPSDLEQVEGCAARSAGGELLYRGGVVGEFVDGEDGLAGLVGEDDGDGRVRAGVVGSGGGEVGSYGCGAGGVQAYAL